MCANYGANTVDQNRAVKMRKFFLDQVSQLAGIIITCRIGDEALAGIIGTA